jgi:hypothetical protein
MAVFDGDPRRGAVAPLLSARKSLTVPWPLASMAVGRRAVWAWRAVLESAHGKIILLPEPKP